MPPNTRDRDSPESARLRAAKACERCNRKRVKCDVTEVGQPCSRCRRNGTVECALTVSRRGRYSRDAIKQRAAHARQASLENGSNPSIETNTSTINDNDNDIDIDNNPPSVPGHHEGPNEDDTPPSTTSPPTQPPSYRSISWSNLFNHFIDTRHHPAIDKCSITYLGESFPLALVLEDLHVGGSLRLHHPGPPLDETTTSSPVAGMKHPVHLLPEDMNCLNAKKAFEYPKRSTYDALIATFLETYYPLYPIVNREEFLRQYHTDTLPWLLLQSCMFVSATFCHESILHRAGYTGRRQARFSFYRKAKALFDTGYESNKIVILQSVMMLSHWGGSPNNYWNFYSWISNGVTIAETLGIHRSLRHSRLEQADKALLRRLWWTLVVRDAFTAVLLGRPFRIGIDMSDADALTTDDFDLSSPNTNTPLPLNSTHAAYHMALATLSLHLRQIVYTRWQPSQHHRDTDTLHLNLQNWLATLPSCLHPQTSSTTTLYPQVLTLLHSHHLILTTLGLAPTSSTCTTTPPNQSVSTNQTLTTATHRITTTFSSLTLHSHLLHLPHETFQSLFLAGVASYVQLRKEETAAMRGGLEEVGLPGSGVGRVGLDCCALVLQGVGGSWDASGWVGGLFERLGGQGGDRHVQKEGDEVGKVGEEMGSMAGMEWIDFEAGEGSPWGSNPMLSALFEFPTEFGEVNVGGMEDGMDG